MAMLVLQSLMGGGGSFTSGGPGKGLTSRLFTNVLARHEFAYSASWFGFSHMLLFLL
jgi:processing peptidase subunit alpha